MYDQRPWLRQYVPGMPADIDIPFASALEMFEHTATSTADRPLIHYFGRTMTIAEVDRATDALAAGVARERLRARRTHVSLSTSRTCRSSCSRCSRRGRRAGSSSP